MHSDRGALTLIQIVIDLTLNTVTSIVYIDTIRSHRVPLARIRSKVKNVTTLALLTVTQRMIHLTVLDYILDTLRINHEISQVVVT